MQNHYNLIYREEEREMFPTLKVWLFYGSNQQINILFGSTSALARSRGLLLLVVFWRALLILILFVDKMMPLTKDTVRTNKSSMRKLAMYASSAKNWSWLELRKLPRLEVLAWPKFPLHGSWVKRVLFYSTVIAFLGWLNIIKPQGVSAPIVGTTSLENLYDLLGIFYLNFFFLTGR